LLTPEGQARLAEQLYLRAQQRASAADLEQRSRLCLQLARNGYPEAREALYRLFRLGPELSAASEIMKLDGADGFRWLCQQVVLHGQEDEQRQIFEELIWCYENAAGENAAQSVFLECQLLAPFWECRPPLERPSFVSWRQKIRAFLSLSTEGVPEHISTFGSRYFLPGLKQWSLRANRAQLEEIAQALQRESEPKNLGHLLTVFAHRSLPRSEQARTRGLD